MDAAGSISGVVEDRATGQPLADALASPASFNDGWGGSSGVVRTGADGRYTLAGYGPYKWTLFFKRSGYAAQWSGGGNNRFTAEGVKIKSGKTTVYDVQLRKGTLLTGTVTTSDGRPFGEARIVVINALTHDEMSSGDTGPDGVYRVPVLGPQDVKIQYYAAVNDQPAGGFYLNAADFAHAKTVTIPANGTKTINVRLALP